MPLRYKLGKKPARHGAVVFMLSNYVDKSILPVPPAAFGQTDVIKDYGMLGNDRWGCCALASAAHATRYWNRLAGRHVGFMPANIIADYKACNNIDVLNDETDQGTDMAALASYRRKTGIVDAGGMRHKVGAYLALHPGDLYELAIATFLFRAPDIGLELRTDAEDQFDAHEPWTLTPGRHVDGGHAVCVTSRHADGSWDVITWGRKQLMGPQYYETCCDEAYAYVAADMLDDAGTVRGFDIAKLNADLAKLGGKR